MARICELERGGRGYGGESLFIPESSYSHKALLLKFKSFLAFEVVECVDVLFNAIEVTGKCTFVIKGLTPPYALMIGFFSTVVVYCGSGPIWYRGVVVQSDWCRENWFLNLLYVNNYIDNQRLCMLQSWYLSADIHLFLLAPVLVYPLWRCRKIGILLTVIALIISIILPAATIYFNKYVGLASSLIRPPCLLPGALSAERGWTGLPPPITPHHTPPWAVPSHSHRHYKQHTIQQNINYRPLQSLGVAY
ncbi:unnamed protein product [Timema podura]|uniref:Acyltransferase 3 domain-containing protein n=1 Tax=Timema podura TaxID=61482 RepID=A0ABN7NR68_TIMPD|nr:unnamed protein product [Timema podura]